MLETTMYWRQQGSVDGMVFQFMSISAQVAFTQHIGAQLTICYQAFVANRCSSMSKQASHNTMYLARFCSGVMFNQQTF